MSIVSYNNRMPSVYTYSVYNGSTQFGSVDHTGSFSYSSGSTYYNSYRGSVGSTGNNGSTRFGSVGHTGSFSYSSGSTYYNSYRGSVGSTGSNGSTQFGSVGHTGSFSYSSGSTYYNSYRGSVGSTGSNGSTQFGSAGQTGSFSYSTGSTYYNSYNGSTESTKTNNHSNSANVEKSSAANANGGTSHKVSINIGWTNTLFSSPEDIETEKASNNDTSNSGHNNLSSSNNWHSAQNNILSASRPISNITQDIISNAIHNTVLPQMPSGVVSVGVSSVKTQLYTVEELVNKYGFIPEYIGLYFDKAPDYNLDKILGINVDNTTNSTVQKYTLKSEFKSISEALVTMNNYEAYIDNLILNNFLNDKNKVSNEQSIMTQSSSGVQITKENYLDYAKEINLKTGTEADKLHKQALDKFIKDFSSGNLAIDQVQLILDAIGVQSIQTKNSNGNYTINFSFGDINYSITCNKIAAAQGTDDVTVDVYSDEDFSFIFNDEEIKEMFTPVASNDSSATYYVLKSKDELKEVFISKYPDLSPEAAGFLFEYQYNTIQQALENPVELLLSEGAYVTNDSAQTKYEHMQTLHQLYSSMDIAVETFQLLLNAAPQCNLTEKDFVNNTDIVYAFSAMTINNNPSQTLEELKEYLTTAKSTNIKDLLTTELKEYLDANPDKELLQTYYAAVSISYDVETMVGQPSFNEEEIKNITDKVMDTMLNDPEYSKMEFNYDNFIKLYKHALGVESIYFDQFSICVSMYSSIYQLLSENGIKLPDETESDTNESLTFAEVYQKGMEILERQNDNTQTYGVNKRVDFDGGVNIHAPGADISYNADSFCSFVLKEATDWAANSAMSIVTSFCPAAKVIKATMSIIIGSISIINAKNATERAIAIGQLALSLCGDLIPGFKFFPKSVKNKILNGVIQFANIAIPRLIGYASFSVKHETPEETGVEIGGGKEQDKDGYVSDDSSYVTNKFVKYPPKLTTADLTHTEILNVAGFTIKTTSSWVDKSGAVYDEDGCRDIIPGKQQVVKAEFIGMDGQSYSYDDLQMMQAMGIITICASDETELQTKVQAVIQAANNENPALTINDFSTPGGSIANAEISLQKTLAEIDEGLVGISLAGIDYMSYMDPMVISVMQVANASGIPADDLMPMFEMEMAKAIQKAIYAQTHSVGATLVSADQITPEMILKAATPEQLRLYKALEEYTHLGLIDLAGLGYTVVKYEEGGELYVA